MERRAGSISVEEELIVPKSIEMEGLSVASEKHPQRNEDAILLLPEKRTFGVFDGVGGSAAGDEASQLAMEKVRSMMTVIPEGLSLEQARIEVEKTLLETNALVSQKAREKDSKMSTTAVFGYIWEGAKGRKVIIGSVGDSRAYLFHKEGSLEQITLDDSSVNSLMNEEEARTVQLKLSEFEDVSKLTDSERFFFNYRNIISQSIGGEKIIPHLEVRDLEPGDKILLTSDGVSDNLTSREIANVLYQSSDSKDAVCNLIKKSKERSRDLKHSRHKADDMSAVVVDLNDKKDMKAFRPKVGDKVRVRRTNGSIEEDWLIFDLEQGIVMKTEGSQTLRKRVPAKELEELNSPISSA